VCFGHRGTAIASGKEMIVGKSLCEANRVE
jgi:hypothetical protein